MTLDPRILAATTLQELQDALAVVLEEGFANGDNVIDLIDEDELPTFGGPPIHRDGGVFSWDETHVLCGDTPDAAAIVTREDFAKAMDEEEADEED
jgi:hypothetical protein